MANTESAQPTRTPRWKRLLRWGGGVLLLLIGMLIGYSFRPLNTVERNIAGTWGPVFDTSDPPMLVTFHPNRTISHANAGGASTGSWSARGDQLWGVPDPPPYPQWLMRMKWRLENHREWLTPDPFEILELTPTHMVLRRAKGNKESFVRATEDQIKE